MKLIDQRIEMTKLVDKVFGEDNGDFQGGEFGELMDLLNKKTEESKKAKQ